MNKLTLTLLLATALTLFACSDDSGQPSEPTDSNNGGTNNGDTNNGDTNNGGTNNGDTNNGTPEGFVDYTLAIDAEGGPAEGLELCVLEHPEVGCTTMGPTFGGDRVMGTLPVPGNERFHFTVTDPVGQFANVIVPIAELDPDGNLGWITLPTAQVDSLHALAGVERSSEEGLVLVFADHDSRDAAAPETVTVTSDSGRVVYLDEDELVDPGRESMSSAGQAAVLNVEPGVRTIRYEGTAGHCNTQFGVGWHDENDEDTLSVRVMPGFVTLLAVHCPGLRGRDRQECDLVAQDCDEGSKCRVVRFVNRDDEDDSGTRCDDDGEVPRGGSCVRPNDVAGEDDCAAGSYCAYWGLAQDDPQPRTCLPYCYGDQQCGDDQYCVGYEGGEQSGGACADTCDPFGSDCVENTHCSLITTTTALDGPHNGFICQFDGVGTQGDPCETSRDCAGGFSCAGFSGEPLTCKAHCNDDNNCDAGLVCASVVGLDTGVCR